MVGRERETERERKRSTAIPDSLSPLSSPPIIYGECMQWDCERITEILQCALFFAISMENSTGDPNASARERNTSACSQVIHIYASTFLRLTQTSKGVPD